MWGSAVRRRGEVGTVPTSDEGDPDAPIHGHHPRRRRRAEADVSPEAWQAIMDDYNEFGAKAGAAGVIGGGEALQPPSTAVGIKVSGKGGKRHPHREALRRGQGGRRRLLPARRRRHGRGDHVGQPDPGRVAGPGRRPAVRRLQHLGLTPGRGRGRVPGRAPALATLTRVLGGLDRAEDAVQDALRGAPGRWPPRTIPEKPGAWITTIARTKAIDRLRRDAKRDDKQHTAHRGLAALDGWDDPDPQVVAGRPASAGLHRCHPAAPDRGPGGAGPAYAVRPVDRRGGSTLPRPRGDDGAAARAGQAPTRRRRRRVRGAGRPRAARPAPGRARHRAPALHRGSQRLARAPSTCAGALCDEARHVAALLLGLMPDEPEVLGLHALIVLTDARRATRLGRRRGPRARSPSRTAQLASGRHRRGVAELCEHVPVVAWARVPARRPPSPPAMRSRPCRPLPTSGAGCSIVRRATPSRPTGALHAVGPALDHAASGLGSGTLGVSTTPRCLWTAVAARAGAAARPPTGRRAPLPCWRSADGAVERRSPRAVRREPSVATAPVASSPVSNAAQFIFTMHKLRPLLPARP